MLAKYQLPSPDLYILKIVQCALAGGARRVRFYTRSYGFEVLWDQSEQVLNPVSQQHLTAGLLAFLAQEGTACKLENSEGQVLFVEGGTIEPEVSEKWWSHRLNLHRTTPPPSAWQRLTSWIPSASPESKRLAQACNHAAVPIFFDDHVLNLLGGHKGTPGPHGVAQFEPQIPQWKKGGYLLSREASAQLFPVAPQAPEKRAIHVLFEDPDDPSPLEHAATISTLLYGGQPALYCWASVHSHSSSWSEATFILDGVCLEPERNLLDRPGYAAYISARGLRTDLTGLHIVHDELYFERLKHVKALIRKLED